MSGAIAAQFLRHQPVRFPSLSFQQLAEEAFGCTPIPTGLHEDVDHVAFLIEGDEEYAEAVKRMKAKGLDNIEYGHLVAERIQSALVLGIGRPSFWTGRA